MNWIDFLTALMFVAVAGVLLGLKYSQIYALAVANSIVFFAFLLVGLRGGLASGVFCAIAASVVMQLGCLCALLIASTSGTSATKRKASRAQRRPPWRASEKF